MRHPHACNAHESGGGTVSHFPQSIVSRSSQVGWVSHSSQPGRVTRLGLARLGSHNLGAEPSGGACGCFGVSLISAELDAQNEFLSENSRCGGTGRQGWFTGRNAGSCFPQPGSPAGTGCMQLTPDPATDGPLEKWYDLPIQSPRECDDKCSPRRWISQVCENRLRRLSPQFGVAIRTAIMHILP